MCSKLMHYTCIYIYIYIYIQNVDCGFIDQVQSSIGKQSELVFLYALLAHNKQKPSTEVIAGLEEALDLHCNAVKVC